MPDLLHARVEACYQLAEDFFKRSFPRPEVSFKLRGQKAGVAHLQENLLRFNPKLYAENREHFLKQTVAHEVAHLVEMNHSARFWAVVERLYPDWRSARAAASISAWRSSTSSTARTSGRRR